MFRVRQEVFDTYWQFAAERQAIFWRRRRGQAAPYTADAILRQYKFCNVYRVCDRVSQFLIRQVIYDGRERSAEETLFRIVLFRLLNRRETWEWLERELGEISLDGFKVQRYDQLLQRASEAGPIYGNAFILCANKVFGYERKHQNHLALLQQMFVDTNNGSRLVEVKSLPALFALLRSWPLLGDFMAYQLAIDCNYSDVFSFSENDFVMAGPGARRGIAKCFADAGGYSAEEIIFWMVEHQEEEFNRLGLMFERIGNRPLQAIDCQGLFCEVDKYCRVAFPELVSNRSRIKSVFQPVAKPIDYVFPPKWNISLRS